MQLTGLELTDFKNIASANIRFSPKINCLLGNNGMGKSNLLDAIYLLSYCRSFSGISDSGLIRRGAQFAMLHGSYSRRGMDEDLAALLRPAHRKSLKRSGKEYKRLADHIGLFPAVLVSPADFYLVAGEPEERRRFVDQIASQSAPGYLDALMRYNQCLQQRNSLLKAETPPSPDLLDALEIQMEMAANKIISHRAQTVDALRSDFSAAYSAIAGVDENPVITYRSSAADRDLLEYWRSRRDRDRAVGYTTGGPHRDDIEFMLMDAPVRRVASQGQTKTFSTALRMAQYHHLSRALGIKPLLLLDDIFDKLDRTRVQSIMAMVADSSFGQIFITDTNRAHLDETIAAIDRADASLWNVTDGRFTPLNHEA